MVREDRPGWFQIFLVQFHFKGVGCTKAWEIKIERKQEIIFVLSLSPSDNNCIHCQYHVSFMIYQFNCSKQRKFEENI